MGFLDHQRSRIDRRSVRIKLTDKGREVRHTVDTLYEKHMRTVEQVGGINADDFGTLNKALHRLSGSDPPDLYRRPNRRPVLRRRNKAPANAGAFSRARFAPSRAAVMLVPRTRSSHDFSSAPMRTSGLNAALR